jgi:two-component system, chemotaxis family, sensor kinase CheA
VNVDIDRDALVRCFIAESDEMLSEMEQTLVALESELANRANHIEKLFRLAHTFKGNATLLDFTAAAELSHSLEDLLETIRERDTEVNEELVTFLLRCVDVLRVMVADAVNGKSDMRPEAIAMFADLEQIRSAKRLSNHLQGSEKPGGVPRGHENYAPVASLVGNNSIARYKTLRVDLKKLDHMVNLAGEIAISRGRLDSALESGPSLRQALDIHREADALFAELRHLVMRLRMVPIGPTFWQFNRAIRDLAGAGGKLARLEVKGADVELDTRVIELIRDPLMHMVRNALDHGIELPEIRSAKGKDPCGVITLSATHSAGNVVIQVSDDGAGFKREEILKHARSRGLVADHQQPSDHDLFRLVFEAGFSTAEKVTKLSGRGVGMDVVRQNIDSLHGSITVESADNNGSTIFLRIPLTLAIIEGFAVRAGDDVYVIPLDSVLECLDAPVERHESDMGGVIQLRGAPLPFIRLRSAFQIPGERPAREQIVVLTNGSATVGLAVDSLLGGVQAVVKPLGFGLQAVSGISGSTVLGSGRVALILDVPNLVRVATRQYSAAAV